MKHYPVSEGDEDNNWLPPSFLISSLYCDTIVTPIWSVHEQASDIWGGHFSKISKNSIKPEPSGPGLFVNFYTKVHYKGTNFNFYRTTVDGGRDRKVSLGQATANATGHRTTISSEVGGQ
ncbi:MAG: hypothetical protein EZS28_037750 [Streblomastix strix]|uniref:Uncharacterized protein n=1 Tax=Streblomastix strix TaxID=222440 RepID=A0A5J4U9Z1_9EUKA|nr:MAG: hypothetical protein EZS28_037750 [Streblomastix strix]